MKKLIALLLSGALMASTLPAAFAADSGMNAQAEAVTRKVKALFNIGDEYTDFQSEYYQERNVGTWELYWSNETEGKSLSVQVTEQGKVLRYSQNSDEKDTNQHGFSPALPKISNAAAKQMAQEFLAKVLTSGETVQIDDDDLSRSGQEVSVSFDIKLNGISSPLNGNMWIDSTGIRNFWRADSASYIGGVPSATPSVQSEEAQSTLRSASKLRLIYTSDPNHQNKDPKKGETKKASLQYVPVDSDERVVDAKSGKLMNLSELERNYFESDKEAGVSGGSANDAAAAPEAENARKSLSEAEISGLDKLKDVMTVQQIDSRVRSMPELGLAGYTLADSNYSYNKVKDAYTCRLSYNTGKKEAYDYKFISVDAKTGDLKSVSGFKNGEQKELEAEAAQTKAQDFLKKYFPDHVEKVALYKEEGYRAWKGFALLERQEQSVACPENYYAMKFDKADGTLIQFESAWDEDMQFDSQEGIIDMDAALESWQKAHPVVLGYEAMVDASQIRYTEKLLLAYQYDKDSGRVYGVDAKSGKALRQSYAEEDQITYTDVAADDKEIMALADLGIGYKGGIFDKAKELTQADMLALLVSANGSYYDLTNEDELNRLYQYAIQLGMIKREQRNPTALVTRMEVIKTILDMSTYGQAAKIPDIFTCTFTDAADIPAADRGYAAIAQGLGLVRGGTDGKLLPKTVATRGQLAIIFYNFMNR